jgi:hypothetical protein
MLRFLLSFLIGILTFSTTYMTYSATTDGGGSLSVDHFEVILPESARVGEAFDVTVKAISK